MEKRSEPIIVKDGAISSAPKEATPVVKRVEHKSVQEPTRVVKATSQETQRVETKTTRKTTPQVKPQTEVIGADIKHTVNDGSATATSSDANEGDGLNFLSRVVYNVRHFMNGRFDLHSDSADQKTVVEEVRKGIDFRGTNLWVLMFAVFIASLGLNMNSTAVIIGAMLVSPLMGPISAMGLSLGINDFDMLKTAWRNFLLMVIVSLLTSTFYFLISPISTAQSELLARTTPSIYDVLIAFFGGMAGMVAQTRKDRSVTVVSGVAIATALMPPLCTAGYGLATGQISFLFGALYLFLINTVFIAVATYLVVLFLRYEKKVVLDPVRQKKNNRYITLILILVGVPSILLGVHIVRRTIFDENVNKYVSGVFQYDTTMVVDYATDYHYDGNKSRVTVRLMGEPLEEKVLVNAEAQLEHYGLRHTELQVKQADTEVDINVLQKSYADIIDEKNDQIQRLKSRLENVSVVDTLAASGLSREIAYVEDNILSMSLSKHISYDDGLPVDTMVVAIIKPFDEAAEIDIPKVKNYIQERTLQKNVMVIVK